MTSLIALSQHLPTQTYTAPKPLDLVSRIRQDVPPLYAKGCDDFNNSDSLKPCEFSTGDPSKTVLLLGDSIGAQWFSAIAAVYPSPEWRFIVLTKSSCPIIEQPAKLRNGNPFLHCMRWRDKALDYVQSRSIDVLFIGSAINYGYTPQQWREGTGAMLRRVSDSAARLILLNGTPALSFDAPTCVARQTATSNTGNLDCREAYDQVLAQEVADALRQAARAHTNVEVLDMSPSICPRGICRALSTNGQAVFRDSMHLTDSYAASMAETLRRHLDR